MLKEFTGYIEHYLGVRIHVLFILLVIFFIAQFIISKMNGEQKKVLDQEKKMKEDEIVKEEK